MNNATVEYVRARVQNFATHEDAGKMLEQYDSLTESVKQLVHVCQNIQAEGITDQTKEKLTYALAIIPEELKTWEWTT